MNQETNTITIVPYLLRIKLDLERIGKKPFLHKPSGRMIISFKRFGCKSSQMTLSRFKMIIKKERWLKSFEDVDHKDNDKSNDDIANLQILSRSKNTIKQMSIIRTGIEEYVCLNCGELFTKRVALELLRIKRGCSGPFCGCACSKTFTARSAQQNRG